ncbi:hypothetical protein Agub_g9309, partial [Astrephomene gubernaculifera]
VIMIRPPRRSEVSEHIREQEASPLALPPLELLRRLLPRAAEVAGWLLMPHAMFSRYVLLVAPAYGVGGEGGGGGGEGMGSSSGGGVGEGSGTAPWQHVGTQLMLLAGALLTCFEVQLFGRAVAELLSLRRPRRPLARRRALAWRVCCEGLLLPLREAIPVWNMTHFIALPLLQLLLPPPAMDLVLLVPLTYCTAMLGAAACDVAARATAALLRVARRVRQHDGGTTLLLPSIVHAADPDAVPLLGRTYTLMLYDMVGQSGRAAVAAALAEEAPALAAELAERRQRRQQQQRLDGDGGGDGGTWGELAAAMRARVAPPGAGDGGRRGARRRRAEADAAAAAAVPGGDAAGVAGGEAVERREGEHGEQAEEEHPPQEAAAADLEDGHEDDEDDDDDDEDEEMERRRAGLAVQLRWPAPLQLPPEVHDWEDVPRGFTCAITQHVMGQPAMLVSPELPAAPTYERAAIQQWLATHMRDPKSNTPLTSYTLLPNEDLHRAIDDWVHFKLKAARAAA